MLIVSSHKIGGPQGSGALVLSNPDMPLTATFGGGGQERNHRAGTENVAAIAGFGAAATEVINELENLDSIENLRDTLSSKISNLASSLGLSSSFHIFGDGSPRLCNTLLFAIDGLSAESALISFDLEGIALSSGSACSAGKVGESHVLNAMGISSELSSCALRVSLGIDTSELSITSFVDVLSTILSRLELSNAKLSA